MITDVSGDVGVRESPNRRGVRLVNSRVRRRGHSSFSAGRPSAIGSVSICIAFPVTASAGQDLSGSFERIVLPSVLLITACLIIKLPFRFDL